MNMEALVSTRKELLKKLDDEFMSIINKITDELYDISKDTQAYLYFMPFYTDIMDKLLICHRDAYNTKMRDKIVEFIPMINKFIVLSF